MATSKRGGRRPGAGRPTSPGGSKPRTVAFRLTEAEYNALLKVAGEGESAGAAAARLVRKVLENIE